MEKFKSEFKIVNEQDIEYQTIGITNVLFDATEIEKYLPEIVFDDDNIKFMFSDDDLSPENRKRIYQRFFPKDDSIKDYKEYIKRRILENKNFYSFLAEGLLALVFRDVYNFELSCGVIDVKDTLIDSHTGADACMYNLEHSQIILGEAKFYEDCGQGINKIISDFITNNINNKLESLQSKAEYSSESKSIIIKNLYNEEYEDFISIQKFMEQDIIFAGFVLHSANKLDKYKTSEFYKNFNISTEALADNIKKSIRGVEPGNYQIILIHLPVRNKKDLIYRIMMKSKENMKFC